MATATEVILFDVNETLSDMAPMAERFTEIGVQPHLAKLWFATLLRDGFALTAAGSNPAFVEVGKEVLRGVLHGLPLEREPEDAVDHVMAGLAGLTLHTDVVDGVRALKSSGYRLVTLSNGSTKLAEKLFADAGIGDDFERLLSVEDAPAWKPAPGAYAYAAEVCGVTLPEMLLVAVHPWDLHGAAAAGAATAWINRSGDPYPGHFSQPGHVVSSLPELAGVLGRSAS